MSYDIQTLINKMTAFAIRLNLIEENKKTNEELPVESSIQSDGLIRYSKNGVSKTITPQNILNQVPSPSYLTLSDTFDDSFVNKFGFVPFVDVNGGGESGLRFKSLPVFEDLVSGNSIINGGFIHVSDLDYIFWATSYVINGVHYDVPIQEYMTLSNGDPLKPRFDVVAIRITGTTPSIVILEGVPDNNPVKPVVNLVYEVELTFRLVAPLESSDPNVITELIYDENIGEPNEWDNTFLIPGGNLDNTILPYTGVKSIKVPAITNGKIEWTKATEYLFDENAKLNFAIKGSLTSGSIQIKLINTTSGIYWLKTLYSFNLLNFNFIPDTPDWRIISIPFSEFYPSNVGETDFNKIEFTFINTTQIELDWINIQSGLPQPEPIITKTYPIIEEVTRHKILKQSDDKKSLEIQHNLIDGQNLNITIPHNHTQIISKDFFITLFQKDASKLPNIILENNVTLLMNENDSMVFTGVNKGFQLMKIDGNVWRLIRLNDPIGVYNLNGNPFTFRKNSVNNDPLKKRNLEVKDFIFNGVGLDGQLWLAARYTGLGVDENDIASWEIINSL